MNIKHYSLGVILAAYAMAWVLLTCVSGVSAQTANGDGGARIVIAAETDYPPYSYVNDAGVPTGFTVELTRAIAEVMGMDIKIVTAPWPEIRTMIEAGEIDAVAGMYYSLARDRTVDFTPPFTEITHAVFARNGTPAITTLDGLHGHAVIVMEGDIMDDVLREEGLTGITRTGSIADALRLLASGKQEYALVARLPGLYWIDKLGLKTLHDAGSVTPPLECCFAVREGDTELRTLLAEGLAIVNKTGRYREIRDANLGVLDERLMDPTHLGYIVLGLMLGGIFFVGVFVWSMSLRVQVALRTKELEDEMNRRHKAEEEVRGNLEIIAILLDTMPQPVYFRDADGKFRGCNNAFAIDLLGRSKESVVGRTVFEIIPIELAVFYHEMDVKLLKSGGTQQYEYKVARVDGEMRDYLFSNAVYHDRKGNPDGIIGVMVDITARRLVEEEIRRSHATLQAVLDAMPVGVAIVDTHMMIRHANGAALSILGYESENEIIGFSCKGILCSHAQEETCPVVGSNNRFEQEEREIVTKNGSKVSVLRSVIPLKTDDGDMLLEAFVDITARKKLEEERMYHEKLKAVVEVAGAACHEINQPLQIIMSNCDFMLIDSLKEPARASSLVDQIKTQAKRIAAITWNLNNITRYETTSYIGSTRIFDLSKGVSSPGEAPRGGDDPQQESPI